MLKVLIKRLLLLALLAIAAVVAIAFSNIEYVGLIALFSILTGVGVAFPHQSKTAVGKFLQVIASILSKCALITSSIWNFSFFTLPMGKALIFFTASLLSLELSLHLGFTFLEDFVTSEIGLYVSCALVIAVAWIFELLSDPNLKCDNCSSRKIDCSSGESSKQYWLYANKDGSPDKRYKTNSLVANYVSIWECRDCSAKTKFKHRANTQPSLTDKVIDSASFKA